MTDRCLTCSVYRPDDKPRLPLHPPVCDGDRRLLDSHLWDIPDLYGRLPDGDPDAPGNNPYDVELANGNVQRRGARCQLHDSPRGATREGPLTDDC